MGRHTGGCFVYGAWVANQAAVAAILPRITRPTGSRIKRIKGDSEIPDAMKERAMLKIDSISVDE